MNAMNTLRSARTVTAAALIALIALLGGCVSVGPENPGWTLSRSEIKAEKQRLRETPVELERPVLVVTGYASVPPMARMYAGAMEELTGADRDRFVAVDLPFINNLRDGVGVVLDKLNERYPHPSEGETIEVDVVGISMGGIVAKLAAEPEEGRPRLNINTLYTLGAPHRGARMAHLNPVDQAAQDMVYKSIMLVKLHENMPRRGYELVPYAMLSDDLVGPKNSAPWGEDPIWVRGRFVGSHFALQGDDRLQIDVARRLRGERQLLVPAPLPGDEPRGAQRLEIPSGDGGATVTEDEDLDEQPSF